MQQSRIRPCSCIVRRVLRRFRDRAGVRGTTGRQSGSNFSVPVVYRKLPNGLRVVISENHAAPVVVVEVMYRIGFRIEPKNRTGFAHLFEHMMFQGSEHVGQVRARPHRQRERRHAERVDAVRPHELLRGDAVERARARDVARGRPDAVAEDHAGNAEEPAGRGQRGSPGQRPEPAVRRVRVARPAAEGEHQLVQRAQFLRRSHRSRGGDARRREEASSTPTTRRTTRCWS